MQDGVSSHRVNDTTKMLENENVNVLLQVARSSDFELIKNPLEDHC